MAVRGHPAVLKLPAVALVGARNASAAGVRFAERLARDLGAAGFAVVSGLARGIDAAAHRASLATGTIAVLAGGHDHIYPREHTDLAEAILAQGALVSEMPFGHEPRAGDFPRRNRLISGLCAGVVVVGGRTIGVVDHRRFALEQGREVFAVPGSPLDPRTEGTNDLIKQGATLVTDAADVVAVLRPILGLPVELRAEEPEAPAPSAEPGAAERARIVELLGPTADRRFGAIVGKLACRRARGAARARTGGAARAPWRRAGVAAVGVPLPVIPGPERRDGARNPQPLPAIFRVRRFAAPRNNDRSHVAERLPILVDLDRHQARREPHRSQRRHHSDVPDDPHGPIPRETHDIAGFRSGTVCAEGGGIGASLIPHRKIVEL